MYINVVLIRLPRRGGDILSTEYRNTVYRINVLDIMKKYIYMKQYMQYDVSQRTSKFCLVRI